MTEQVINTGNPHLAGGMRPVKIENRPLKDKLRIMAVSDSPWAPTGFGTNTKNISDISSSSNN